MAENYGKISLIGAGPGDPGLITLKAMECIKNADVVVYDYLASPALLKYAKNDSEIIYVGKKGGNHTLSQDGINDLIINKAKLGLNVARLKGGDPFIFGRGGEEAELIADNNIPFEIIPGVTSAIAAPAYAGIPLTHREHSSSVSIITGHEDPTKKDSSIEWESFAKSTSTLVFLMGVKNLPGIVENLQKYGKDSQTPVALVRWGTTPKQQSVTGILENIVEKVKIAGLKSPAIIIIGSVVKLKDKLKWFEHLPLLGKKIVVTRARAQASDLIALLRKYGAECIEIPTIKINPPKNILPLKKSIDNISSFDWVIFTSVNGVQFFFDTLYSQNKDVRILGHLKFACIGPVTKKILKKYGIISDVLPETYKAESVVKAFSGIEIKGKNILIPRAKEARAVLPQELKKMGAIVEEVTAYETSLVDNDKDTLVKMLENNDIDIVTFTSSSTVKNFAELLPSDKFEKLIKNVTSACIGPITEKTARSLGFSPEIVATDYTIDGLMNSILKYFTK
ncbi:MAG: uroporphyrinogen-III C-methyltransferase [Desulfobacteraceae bacterium]|nr:uroporphyrinogen-III C-methyltransferase [Desulfobacteraceae bacterium]